jgi:ubiquinone/menaquinone biosynthesis C-methylase UbiE
MKFKVKMNNLLWDFYPFFYDEIKGFPPYKEMLKKVVENLSPRSGKYLDLGCGTGNLFLEILQVSKNAVIYGLDSSTVALKLAHRKLKIYDSNVRLCKFRFADKLPFSDNYLNGITAINLINYLELPVLKNLFYEARRILKDGGKLCLVYAERMSCSSGVDDFKSFLRTESCNAVSALPWYLIIGVMNLPMRFQINMRLYEKNYIEQLLQKLGFDEVKSEKIYYGGTSVFTIAKKNARFL